MSGKLIDSLYGGFMLQKEMDKPYISAPLQEFNRIYKKSNEIYHNIALQLGLSNSAFDILYSICELGDGCLQKDICARNLYSQADRQLFHSPDGDCRIPDLILRQGAQHAYQPYRCRTILIGKYDLPGHADGKRSLPVYE